LKGWFVAPETSAYRFHLTCDDNCEVFMGLNTSDPLNATRLARRSSYTNTRQSLRLMGSDVISGWVNLTKDQAYFIEGRHYDQGGGDNFAVGLEINKTDTMNITGHHNAMREIQYVSAGPVGAKQEVTRITISNPNKGGTFLLAL
jgi:hypothetical protein